MTWAWFKDKSDWRCIAVVLLTVCSKSQTSVPTAESVQTLTNPASEILSVNCLPEIKCNGICTPYFFLSIHVAELVVVAVMGEGGVFNETVKGTKPVTPLDRDYNVVNETKVRKLGGYAKRVRMESVTRDCPWLYGFRFSKVAQHAETDTPKAFCLSQSYYENHCLYHIFSSNQTTPEDMLNHIFSWKMTDRLFVCRSSKENVPTICTSWKASLF